MLVDLKEFITVNRLNIQRNDRKNEHSMKGRGPNTEDPAGCSKNMK